MIYISAASYPEAEAIIKKYGMKKDLTHKKIQIYRAAGEILVISSTGAVNVSVSAAYLLSSIPLSDDDIFIGLGICRETAGYISGEIVLCNKIIDAYSNRAFYPELLIKHPFTEGSLTSLPEHSNGLSPDGLTDTEGAYFFQAAAKFMPLHNIFVLKVITDITESINAPMTAAIEKISSWLSEITALAKTSGTLTEIETAAVSAICDNLRLTAFMRSEINKLFCRYKRSYEGIQDIAGRYLTVTVQEKKESRAYYEQLKQELME